MNILIIIRVALRALAKNKMRAALTVLGIVIGVWAVILLVSISQSAGNKVRNEIMSLGGTNVIYVFHSWKSEDGEKKRSGTGLVSADGDALAQQCSGRAGRLAHRRRQRPDRGRGPELPH